MNKPQPSISVQFGTEWRIRRPYLYRYLEKRFVDAFFETGKLRISSFSSFSEHSDEQRLDTSEGKGIVSHTNSEGEGQTIIAAIGQGHNAYVLCASTFYGSNLADAFNTDSGFRIDDIFGFANAISRHVPGFNIGLEGPCLYLEQRVLERDMGRIDLEEMRISPDSNNLDMGKMMGSMFSIAGDDMFFLEHSKYAHQSEYRLLWHTPKEVQSSLDVECPEAAKFCTRFEEMNAEFKRSDT